MVINAIHQALEHSRNNRNLNHQALLSPAFYRPKCVYIFSVFDAATYVVRWLTVWDRRDIRNRWCPTPSYEGFCCSAAWPILTDPWQPKNSLPYARDTDVIPPTNMVMFLKVLTTGYLPYVSRRAASSSPASSRQVYRPGRIAELDHKPFDPLLHYICIEHTWRLGAGRNVDRGSPPLDMDHRCIHQAIPLAPEKRRLMNNAKKRSSNRSLSSYSTVKSIARKELWKKQRLLWTLPSKRMDR